jgi:hypothetical protein
MSSRCYAVVGPLERHEYRNTHHKIEQYKIARGASGITVTEQGRGGEGGRSPYQTQTPRWSLRFQCPLPFLFFLFSIWCCCAMSFLLLISSYTSGYLLVPSFGIAPLPFFSFLCDVAVQCYSISFLILRFLDFLGVMGVNFFFFVFLLEFSVCFVFLMN